jgi:hypothetical protein
VSVEHLMGVVVAAPAKRDKVAPPHRIEVSAVVRVVNIEAGDRGAESAATVWRFDGNDGGAQIAPTFRSEINVTIPVQPATIVEVDVTSNFSSEIF